MRNAKAFSKIFMLGMMLSSTLLLTHCNDDDPTPGDEATGQLQVEITDAPVDDAAVKGVFVTIARLKIDGKEVDGFERQTIDLTAYQNGATALLGMTDLQVDNYSRIDLVLDFAEDADNNNPGCYVLTQDGQKDAMSVSGMTQTEISAQGQPFEINENAVTTVVIDFDLRKSIQRAGDNDYAFVTDGELNAALRLVDKAEVGTIEGDCDDWDNYADMAVVYAYKKGEFDANTETQRQGPSKIRFANAVSSATVAPTGQFELHFLEAGNYELYFAGYEDSDSDGTFELTGSLSLDVLGSTDLGSISVGANTTTSVDLTVTGILPL